ncbi:MAG TPA: hypothetical protein VIL31_05420 [Cyclobacteriaceae bacterium]|jgi:hypothetical protein|nr:hypothetical protein [Cyclobacteriaceae bacterium]
MVLKEMNLSPTIDNFADPILLRTSRDAEFSRENSATLILTGVFLDATTGSPVHVIVGGSLQA